jgi:Protein of unknown function (DUF4199)
VTLKGLNLTTMIGIGMVAGLIQAVAGIVMYVAGVYFTAWSMLVTMLVWLVCVVVGTRWYRAKFLHNKLTYVQALIIGIVISVCTGLIYAVYNIVSISFFYPNFLDDFVRARMDQATSPQNPESFASMRAQVSTAAIATSNLIRLAIFGSVLSLLTSLFLKRQGESAAN